MEKDIIIQDQIGFEKKKARISEAGRGAFHIRADFDRTLTKAFVDGKSIPSLISTLRDGNYLTPEYAVKANALYDKYHPIEIDPNIPFEQKREYMRQWWQTHFDLLIHTGLNKKDLEKVVQSSKVRFRQGFSEFAALLKDLGIPLIIISSSGLGKETISMYLEKESLLYGNIYIISNEFEWDKNGRAVGVEQPIIHTLNKDQSAVQESPFLAQTKERKNVLLLGDSLDDVGMVKGFNYTNLLSVGFLNENIEQNKLFYAERFDVVLLNDTSLSYVNNLLKSLFK